MPIKRKLSGRNWSGDKEVMEKDSEVMARFVRACEEGDVEEVKHLLETVSQPNFPREKLEVEYRAPIYWACKYGHLDVVKILIDRYPGSNPHLVTDKGHNLLHVACAKGHISVAYYLHDKYNISATEPNRNNVTPVFTATNSGHLGMVKFLINDLKCNPKMLNDSGDSLLHHACYKNHLEIAQYLVEKHDLNPDTVNKSKSTSLHSACSGGSLPVVQYLVEKAHSKLEVFDSAGSTPLHNACRNGHCDIVQYFITKRYNLNLYNNSGCTPFHVGCQFGRKEVVKVLLSDETVDPNTLTLRGLSPSDLTKDRGTISQLIRGGTNLKGLGHVFSPFKNNYPLQPIVHVFMIGHSTSGKSTLVAALQKPKKLFPGFPPSPVPPYTTGIISFDYDSPEFGKNIFYDFAGHDEYHPSHAALLEHSKFASPPLFLLLIKLMDPFSELKRKINYWIQFIENHCIPKGNSPCVMVVGSHPDMLPKNNLTNVHRIQDYIKYRAASSILHFKGFYSIDCRYPTPKFRAYLKECCSELRKDIPVELPCHVLYSLLQQQFQKSFACSINDVIKKAQDYEFPLPLQCNQLCRFAECISARTKHIFLKNPLEPEKSWIVLDIDSLLQKVHGKIFAPVELPEHVFQPTQAGVLPWSQISKQFPDLEPTLVVAFLRKLEFCQIISDSEVLTLIKGMKNFDDGQEIHASFSADENIDTDGPIPYNRSRSDGHQLPAPQNTNTTAESGRRHSSEDVSHHCQDMHSELCDKKYLFFPSLISPEQPRGDMWLKESIFEHYFGWCLQCVEDHEFFVLRFLQTLLLRLSYNFAVSKSRNSRINELECTLWKNGLRWLNLNGIETIVEFVEDRKALVMLMRITGKSLMNGLHLRSEVIRKVLDTKNEYCSQVHTEEYLIHPEDLKARHGYPVINRPVRELRRYDVHIVARAFCDKTPYLFDTEQRKLVELEQIIGFDPYMKLGENILRSIYRNGRLDHNLLHQISLCYPEKGEHFEHIFFGNSSSCTYSGHGSNEEFINPCFTVLNRFWETRTLDISDLRRRLDKFSIFQGRNILSL